MRPTLGPCRRGDEPQRGSAPRDQSDTYVSSQVRQRDGTCDSFAAQHQALARRRIPRRASQWTAENEPWVDQQLDKDFSPDVIAGRAKVTGAGRRLSSGTIYKIIEKNRRNGGQMVRKLPRQGRKFRKNRTGPPDKGKLKVRKGQGLVDRSQGGMKGGSLGMGKLI